MGKQWCSYFFVLFLAMMVGDGSLNAIIDPYFHYHKPLAGLAYKIYNERYQNDGIVKHFDYDAIITGTSMVENFKTSQMDVLFGTNAIKVPYAGAGYKEIRENLERAIKANHQLKMVVWGLDYYFFYGRFDWSQYDSYPTYLYDEDLLNDVNYIFNIDVLGRTCRDVIVHTLRGQNTTTFDEYNNWNGLFTFGKDTVLKKTKRPSKQENKEYAKLNPENIEKNVLELVRNNPDIEFYLFWTPYSIVMFDAWNQVGSLQNILRWEKEALELMLPYKNVHFFSFFDEYDIITNLDNYKDIEHYHERINAYMLECMATGKHRLILDNYAEYCQREWDFYTTYDYDAIYK